MSVTKKLLEQRHPTYTENHFMWQYYSDHYAGGILYPSKVCALPLADLPPAAPSNQIPGTTGSLGVARYLWQYPLEKQEKFRHRLARAIYVNICAPVVDFYTATIGKKDNITYIEDPNFEFFEDNADLQGRSFGQFMNAARVSATVRGHTFLFVDSTAATAPLVTERDRQDQGIRPYILEILPENLLNWRLDAFGHPTEILFRVEGEVPGKLLDSEDDRNTRDVEYRYWSRTEWAAYKQDRDGVITETASGTNSIGEIPIIPLYHRFSRPYLGESLLKDSAKVGQLLTNWASSMDEAFEVQMFAIPVWKSRKSPVDGGIGVTTVLHCNPEEDESFEYVTPDVQPFEAGWDSFYRLIQLANKHMGIAPSAVSADKIDAKSGIAKQWDFYEAEKILARMAVEEQETAEGVFRLVGLWTGKDFQGSVQYATSYDLATAQDDINDMISLQSAGMPPTARQELMRRVIAKKMPNLPEDKQQAIQDEIDNLGIYQDPAELANRLSAAGPGAKVQPMAKPVDKAGRPMVVVQPNQPPPTAA